MKLIFKLDQYHPVIFDRVSLLPEFLEIIRANSHRLEGLLDIYVAKPNIKIHTYVLLMEKPKPLIELPLTGFNVLYVFPLMGVTSPNPAYKGMGKKINEAVASVASLFNVKIIHVETSVNISRPIKRYNDYLAWWSLVVKDIQPKLN